MSDGINTLENYLLINLRKVDFVNQLPDGLKCLKCQLLLQFPKQTSCGHRFCEECIIQEMLRGSNTCPVDGEPLKINPDNACIRELMALECNCPNRERRCSWTGAAELLRTHKVTCTEELLVCSRCQAKIPRCEITTHLGTCARR